MLEIFICIFLGLFVGLYTAFTGTTGATAILIFLLLFLNILPNQTVIAGTMLFVSCLPLGIFGIYDFYKNNKINYTIASAIIVGISVGIYFGSRYAIEVNKILGEKTGDKIKFGLTAFIYGILSLLYLYQLYMT
jgi:uncharacterized membrane protein YfcA